MKAINDTLKAFEYPNSLIKEYQYWVVLLRPKQVTLGSVVIANKSDATYLGELSEEEWAEFAKVSSDIELALINTFGAEKFNYLALMMKDPNAHFHVIPRYSKSVIFNDQVFEDKDWPTKTELEAVKLSDHTMQAIKAKLLGVYS